MKRQAHHFTQALVLLLMLVLVLSILPVSRAQATEAIPPVSDTEPLTVKIYCTDGKGWGGNKLALYVNGQQNSSFTMSAGYSQWTYTVDYNPEYLYEFKWIPGTTQKQSIHLEILQGSTVLFSATEADCWGFMDSQVVYAINDRFTLDLTDSYGDGWNGNKLALYVDGVHTVDYTISSGKTATYTINREIGKNYEFRWVKGTNYASECSFTIKRGSATILSANRTMCGNYTHGQSLYSPATTVYRSGTCGANGNNVTWTLYNDGHLVIDGSGDMYNFYSNFSKAPWWDYRGMIRKVTIKSGVTSLGPYAFYYCSALTDVVIEGNVKNIGASAFYQCDSLKSIPIPNGPDAIGDTAFAFCTSLESITLPASVKSIGHNAFWECTNLTSCGILGFVTTIDRQAFCGCSSLCYISIPDSVTTLGEGAFWGCSSLDWIAIPSQISSLGYNTFYQCSSLNSIVIPANITSISSGVFDECSNLNQVIFEGDAPTFGDLHVFSGVQANVYYRAGNDTWTSDVMRNYGGTLTWIAQDCEDLGNSHNWADATCTQPQICTVCDAVSGSALGHDWQSNVCSRCNATQLVVHLGDSYGDGWNGNKLQIYEGTQLISTIAISSGKTFTWTHGYNPEVGYTFKWVKGSYPNECSISINNGGENYFSKSNLSTYSTGDTVYILCDHAWNDATCTEAKYCPRCCNTEGEALGHDMAEATCTAPSTCTRCDLTEGEALGHIWEGSTCSRCGGTNYMTLHLHDSYGDGWNGNSLKVYEDGVLVGTYTVDSGKTGADHNIPYDPNKVYTFEWTKGSYSHECSFEIAYEEQTLFSANANDDCRSYTDGQIVCYISDGQGAASVTGGSCGENAYWVLSADGTLTIYGSGNMDNYNSFNNPRPWDAHKDSIANVVIKEGITNIGGCAFMECTNLVGVSIADTVTQVQYHAFYGCSGLTEITLPGNLSSIGENAFNGSGLTSVIIPESTTNIGNYAFGSCSQLTEIRFCGNAPAFSGTDIFTDVTAIAHYYRIDETWTDEVLQNYGGTITWTASGCEDVLKEHTWADATCTVPQTCTLCSDTTGEALGHDWADATCLLPQTCNRCQLTEGEALGHDWADASCSFPETCNRCSATQGEALGHSWVDATCSEPQTCSVCNTTTGSPTNAHVYGDDMLCTACSHQCQLKIYMRDTEKDGWDGNASLKLYINGVLHASYRVSGTSETKYVDFLPNTFYEFRWNEGTYDSECRVTISMDNKQLIYTSCGGYDTGDLIYSICSHSWVDATCTAPKTCSLCNATEGESLGHDWADPVCGEYLDCTRCDTDGEFIDHDWVSNGSKYVCARCNADAKITIKFYDTGNDGWENNRIYIAVNNYITYTYSPVYDYNYSTNWDVVTETLTYDPNNTYQFRFVVKTDPHECSFEVYVGGILKYSAPGTLLETVPSVNPYAYGYPLYTLCWHNWQDATCTAPKTCSRCQQTEGVALGHDWIDATCTAPKTCNRCQATEGEALGHDLGSTTCNRCSTQVLSLNLDDSYGDGWNGNKLEVYENGVLLDTVTFTSGSTHSWKTAFDPEATYSFKWVSGRDSDECYFTVQVGSSVKFTASRNACDDFATGQTVYAICEHTYDDATCTAPQTCSKCGMTEGSSLGHSWVNADCINAKTCTRCNTTSGDPLGHSWVNATCTEAKYCSRCQLSEGEPLGHSYGDGVCIRCGKYYVNFQSATISLAGNIAINFYVELGQPILDDEGAYMSFTLPDGTTKTAMLSDAEVSVKNGVTRYVFTCEVHAKQMADMVVAQMHLGDGTAVGDSRSYSVVTYAGYIIAHEDQYSAYPSLVNLLKTMLNYGAYSQIHFNYNVSNLANANLNLTLNDVTLQDVEAYRPKRAGSMTGLEITSVTLILRSETVLRFYYTLSSGCNIEDYNFVVNGQAVRPIYNQDNGRYYVDVTNIAAKDLDREYGVTITNKAGTESLSVIASAMSYVYQVIASPSYFTEDVKDVVKAMYAYNIAANAYFK